MIDFIDTRKGYVILIMLHLVLGAALKFAPIITAIAYPGMMAVFLLDILYNYDKGSRAGYYALYMVGYEMVYRMAGAPFSWELGKYSAIIILTFGLFIGPRRNLNWIFLFLLGLLIPAIFLSHHSNPDRLYSMIMFNISGPLSLVAAGLYYYKRIVLKEDYFAHLRWAFLPAFTIIAGLSLVANIADLEFTSVQSSSQAAGGFGPNQVSTILGWFILLALLYKVNGERITPFKWLDWLMLFYLVLRALLTFSRGGVMGSLLAFLGAVTVLFFSYYGFRKQLRRSLPFIVIGVGFFVGVFFIANKITNNFLLYRYQGLNTTEVMTGQRTPGKSMLTGRDEIMKADFIVFKQHPLFGVGYGMGELYRARYYGQYAAAHTEFARLMSENGLLGMIFMFVGLICMPVYFFFSSKDYLTRCFMLAFYLLSMFTMFHAAMRLALPGVVFGAAFMRIVTLDKLLKGEHK
jgi:O-antigen ligase